jgi:hypothetical protein
MYASVRRGNKHTGEERNVDESDRAAHLELDDNSSRLAGPEYRIAAVRAAEQLALRRQRGALFGGDLFGEGTWDILLELMIAKFKGTRTSVKSVRSFSGVPATTALRCVEKLEARGLVHRRRYEAGKREWLDLDEGAYRKLATLLLTGSDGAIL